MRPIINAFNFILLVLNQVYTFLIQIWQGRIRSFTVVLTALALISCSLGLPLPLQVDNSEEEPYPCQNSACGCINAEMCWKNCCCYTNEQKLAWAKKHGVTPPAYVFAAVQKSRCCNSKQQIAKAADLNKSCCCQTASSCCSQKPQPKQTNNKSTMTTLVTIQVLKCRGLTSLVTALPPMVLPYQGNQLEFLSNQIGTVSIDNSLYFGPYEGPESPPPQLIS